MKNTLNKLRHCAQNVKSIDVELALALLKLPNSAIPELLAIANLMRLSCVGEEIHLCSIVNAKSGACKEDCRFCAQSVSNQNQGEVFPLRTSAEIAKEYERSADFPIGHFGIVTSGNSLNMREKETLHSALETITPHGPECCASLGSLVVEDMKKLKNSGLTRYHHNLETAESFFPEICTSHSYAERLETVRAAKKAGLEVCSGGLLGMGESLEQRVELAMALAKESVDSIPLNFLVPIPGTALEKVVPLTPLEVLRCIAMFRMTNPNAEIKVCAGRKHLRDIQSMIFYAGASGMMIGDLLTVAGRSPADDLQMLEDLGFTKLIKT